LLRSLQTIPILCGRRPAWGGGCKEADSRQQSCEQYLTHVKFLISYLKVPRFGHIGSGGHCPKSVAPHNRSNRRDTCMCDNASVFFRHRDLRGGRPGAVAAVTRWWRHSGWQVIRSGEANASVRATHGESPSNPVQLTSLRKRVETQLRPPTTGASEQRARHCRSVLSNDHFRGQQSCRRGASSDDSANGRTISIYALVSPRSREVVLRARIAAAWSRNKHALQSIFPSPVGRR
jgi:hypothetical protein